MAMASKTTIRNFIGRVRIEEGSMGRGSILVAEDDRLGPLPICSVNLPLHTQAENQAVAEYLADAWNEGLSPAKKARIVRTATK